MECLLGTTKAREIKSNTIEHLLKKKTITYVCDMIFGPFLYKKKLTKHCVN